MSITATLAASERVCLQCGVGIEHKHRNAKFCGRPCQSRYNHRNEAARGVDGRGNNLRRRADAGDACVDCGASIAHRHGNATRCEACAERKRLDHRSERTRPSGQHARRYGPWSQVLKRDPCAYCGATSATLDHVQALANGGEDELENLVGACHPCNGRKGRRPLLEFLIFERIRAEYPGALEAFARRPAR